MHHHHTSCLLTAAILALTTWAGCADTSGYFQDSNTSATDAAGPDGPAPLPDLVGLESLRIEPEDAVLHIVEGKQATQRYRAWGKFKGGAEKDITANTIFNVRDTSVGLFKGDLFTSALNYGGKTAVLAETPVGVAAETTVTIVYQRVIVEPDVPQDRVAAFNAATADAGRGPELVYPPDGTLIPPNLLELEFQWRPGAGNDLFELSLSNGGTDLRIYTKCKAVGSGCGYTPSPDTWNVIVTTFRGKDAAEVKVRGTDAATAKSVGTSNMRRLLVGEEDMLGGLYYWNATPGTIIRYDFGKPKPKAAEFYNAVQAKAMFCVGCHALSRDGKRMAVGLDMPAPAPLKVLDVPTRGELASGAANFMSFSPDGAKIITSDGNSLVLQESDTLKVLDPSPLQAKGTMPDWSPDGALVVYAEPAQTMPLPFGTPGIEKGSLRLLGFDPTSGSWKGPTSLVDSAGENNYYPTFSPDSQFVGFNRASGSSYDAPDATVWLVRADGSAKPVELEAANRADGQLGAFGNSWPKFAPFVQKYRGRKLMWLTFSSRRDYGLRLAGEKRAQLWMTAIDPDKAELSSDPSYPAFWLPFQDIGTGNHIAQWTAEVVRKECGESDCPAGEFCEDGFCEPGIK